MDCMFIVGYDELKAVDCYVSIESQSMPARSWKV